MAKNQDFHGQYGTAEEIYITSLCSFKRRVKSFLSGKITCPSTIKLDTFAKKCENSTDMRGNNLARTCKGKSSRPCREGLRQLVICKYREC